MKYFKRATLINKENVNNISQEKGQVKSMERNEKGSLWKKDTCVIAGDSMLNDLYEGRISKKISVKVRPFPVARMQDLYLCLIPILEKEPTNPVLDVVTSDVVQSTYQKVVNDLLA